MITSKYAHSEKARKAERVNVDGNETKLSNSAVVQKGHANITSGSPITAGADRTRTAAVMPQSGVAGNFVAVADMSAVVGLRPGELEHLQGHGISVGVVNGVLSVQRKYAPAAQGLIQQVRGR